VTVEQQLIENFEISSKACETTTLHAHIARRSGEKRGKKKIFFFPGRSFFASKHTRTRIF
jgi:hypothetical protein